MLCFMKCNGSQQAAYSLLQGRGLHPSWLCSKAVMSVVATTSSQYPHRAVVSVMPATSATGGVVVQSVVASLVWQLWQF